MNDNTQIVTEDVIAAVSIRLLAEAGRVGGPDAELHRRMLWSIIDEYGPALTIAALAILARHIACRTGNGLDDPTQDEDAGSRLLADMQTDTSASILGGDILPDVAAVLRLRMLRLARPDELTTPGEVYAAVEDWCARSNPLDIATITEAGVDLLQWLAALAYCGDIDEPLAQSPISARALHLLDRIICEVTAKTNS